jgi:hypothetical protein
VYCSNCGIDLGPVAKFCSSCGNNLATPAAQNMALKARDWEFHVNLLGWVVIAHAALVAVIGFIAMFGGFFMARLLEDHPGLMDNRDPDIPPPDVLAHVLGPAGFMIGVFFLLIALPSIIAGVGLLRYRRWGRGLTLVLSFLRILEFPFGTATAIYSFWVLLSQEGKSFYGERAARAES